MMVFFTLLLVELCSNLRLVVFEVEWEKFSGPRTDVRLSSYVLSVSFALEREYLLPCEQESFLRICLS